MVLVPPASPNHKAFLSFVPPRTCRASCFDGHLPILLHLLLCTKGNQSILMNNKKKSNEHQIHPKSILSRTHPFSRAFEEQEARWSIDDPSDEGEDAGILMDSGSGLVTSLRRPPRALRLCLRVSTQFGALGRTDCF